MANPGVRHIDIDSLVDDMRPPTEDDVPMRPITDRQRDTFDIA